ncbi:unnamed protein product [Aureobasidium pullulans]|nr:unnamed protein product [Aureobasidium pullulans]
MIEDHHGYRSINRGALQLSLGKFVVYTSELLLRHEVVFTLGSNPSDLCRYKEYWPASTRSGQVSLNLTFAHLFDDFFSEIEVSYVLGNSELSRIEFASRLEELDRGFKEEAIAYDEFGIWNLENLDNVDYNMLTTKDLIVIRDQKWEEILIDAQTRGGEMIDTLEELENEIISRSSSGETEHEMVYSANPVRMHKSPFGQVLDDHERPELLLHARQELEARNSLSTYIHSWIFKLKDRWILQEQPSSILHHLKQCMACRHSWVNSSCGTEYLEELIATQDVIFGDSDGLFRYSTSEALKIAASVRKWIRVLEACGLTTTRRTGVKIYAMGNTDPDYLPLLKSLMKTAYQCDSTKVFFEAFSFSGYARFHATYTLGNSTSSLQRLLPALAEKDREFKEAVKKDEMHLIARECFWDEEIPGAMASRDAKWKKFIETTREYTEKLLDMLESLEENPVLLYDFHADEDRWPDAHGPEIADSEDEGLLSE